MALLEGRAVGSVRRHAIVQGCAAGHEALGLGVIGAVHEAHEFAHVVAVEPRRAEGVLGDQPARREDHEVDVRGAGVCWRGQHREDRRIRMIEADRADRVEPRQIVFVRRVVAVPGDHVERRMIDLGRPQIALEFATSCAGASRVFVGGERGAGSRAGWRGHWRRSARVRATGRARRNSRRHSRAAPVRQLDAEFDATRNDGDLAGPRLDHAELGTSRSRPPAARSASRRRHCRSPVGHRAIGAIDMDRHARARAPASPLPPIVTIPSTKSAGRVGKWNRIPAQPVRRRLGLVEGRAAHQPVSMRRNGAVHPRRPDAVEPGAPVLGARRGERGARQLLGVEAAAAAAAASFAPRHRACHRFGRELVAEPRQVGRFRLARGRLSAFSHSDPGVRTYQRTSRSESSPLRSPFAVSAAKEQQNCGPGAARGCPEPDRLRSN